MSAKRNPPRPSWALAYILQNWKRDRDVAKAYKLACADEPTDVSEIDRRPSDEVFAAVVLARDQLKAYVRALDSVLAEWDAP